MPGLIQSSMLIFKKDLLSEFRTRYALNSLLMFALVTISIIRFAVGDEQTENEILTGLLWIAIFFTSSGGLSRVFIKEEEKETSPVLKLSSGSLSVFIGKLFFNLLLTFAATVFILLLFVMIMDYQIENLIAFLMILVLGILGLVSASTFIAAIISKANSKGTLYPVLSFPILLPLLLTVINAAKLASLGVSASKISGEFVILISYDIVVTTISLMLFKFVWED